MKLDSAPRTAVVIKSDDNSSEIVFYNKDGSEDDDLGENLLRCEFRYKKKYIQKNGGSLIADDTQYKNKFEILKETSLTMLKDILAVIGDMSSPIDLANREILTILGAISSDRGLALNEIIDELWRCNGRLRTDSKL